MSQQRINGVGFRFTNFAGIETCEMALTPLTVIAGPNSAGKTYIVYAIYSLLKNLLNFISVPLGGGVAQELIAAGSLEIDVKDFASHNYSQRVSALFMRQLPYFFSVNENFFSGAKVEIKIPAPDVASALWEAQVTVRKDLVLDINKPANSTVCSLSLSSAGAGSQAEPRPNYAMIIQRRLERVLAELTFSDSSPRPFPITSERTGISLFWKELDINKNKIIDKIVASKGKKIDPWELIEDEAARYALPITDNVDIARDAENVSKSKSFIASDPEKFKYIRKIFDQIAGGRYKYGQDGISFEYGKGLRKSVIPIYVASSSTKSLFLLDLYINNVAAPGDLLVFDEPELNLHLANQGLMAQLLVRLVSLGVNILITTHSDFLIREINNRVMLSKEFRGREEIMAQAGIDIKEVLLPTDVSGYLLKKDRKLERVSVNEFGLNMSSIDDAISVSSNLQGSILSQMTADEGEP